MYVFIERCPGAFGVAWLTRVVSRANRTPGKHRKVRCHFVCDSDRSCRECLARGLVCRSQDYPEPENARESDRVSLNERLGRVESLLENVLERLDSVGATEALPVLPSSGVDKSPNSSAVVTPANENAPVLSLFDNEVVCIQELAYACARID